MNAPAAAADRATTQPAPRVAAVETERPTTVVVTFDDGESRRFDLAGALDLPVFRPLREEATFRRVRVTETRRGIEWESGGDLSGETIYHSGEAV